LPIYEYRCRNGHTFEVLQSMSHDPVTVCEVCGDPVERVFHPVAVHFKGSGFYSTDYGRQRGGGGSDSDSSGSKDESKKEKTGSKSEGSSSSSEGSSSSSSSDSSSSDSSSSSSGDSKSD
jgi:putative FmdB family regulatory protein